MQWWNSGKIFDDARARLFLRTCGLLFQSGAHLDQVARYSEPWTGEAFGPTAVSEVPLAGLFAGKLTLKLAQICGKGRTPHLPTLPLVLC
jgi:hypothetical protein